MVFSTLRLSTSRTACSTFITCKPCRRAVREGRRPPAPFSSLVNGVPVHVWLGVALDHHHRQPLHGGEVADAGARSQSDRHERLRTLLWQLHRSVGRTAGRFNGVTFYADHTNNVEVVYLPAGYTSNWNGAVLQWRVDS